MNAPVLRVERHADLYNVIATLEQAGAQHRIPLLRALLHGRIAHFECQRSTSGGTLKRFLGMVDKPALILLADDDYASTGPDGWPVTDRALRWARYVVIHATGGTPEQYDGIVDATVATRRVVLVEADSAHAAKWVARVKALPHRPATLLMLPRDGAAHPVLPGVRQ